jgi:Flp pilus assembly secretin CpaC
LPRRSGKFSISEICEFLYETAKNIESRELYFKNRLVLWPPFRGLVFFLHSHMLKRVFLLAVALGSSLVFAQTGPETAPSPEQETTPPAAPQTTPEPENQNSGGVIDEIERALREKENAEAAAAARMPPSQPRTHRYTNQPLSRVLRILAEQAEINYIEPNFPAEERISFTLLNLTPLQAFYEIAQSRGFQVVTDGTKYTLRRSDIESPSFYITKRYRIKHQAAEYLEQPIANFLGIAKMDNVRKNYPAYPELARLPQEATSNTGATTTTITPTTSSTQTEPRYEPGLPFDAPLFHGGFSKKADQGPDEQVAVFVERSSNSLVVRATPEEQEMIALEISRLDREERQILIKTYVVEVDQSKGLGAGIDWSQALGLANGQGATFAVKSIQNQQFPSSAGTVPSQTSGTAAGIGTLTDVLGNLTPGKFFTNGLILDVNNLQIVLHALQTRGRVRGNNSPMTVAKSGMPVTIRSVTTQTIFITTPGTNNYPPTSAPYTFTTGLTIDIVARILDSGLIDMNLNPALSTVTGQSPAEAGTNTTIPIISTRSTTANVTVRSGQAAVIGGILQDTSTFNANGIPLISRIPVLGYLFKSKIGDATRTNLIVIVSPTIIPARNQRQDRLGEIEQDTLERSSDLPGEPPPFPYGRSGKDVRFMSRSKHN